MTRHADSFGPKYTALQDSQEVAGALEHVDPKRLEYPIGDYTGAFVLVADGEYLEVWVSVWGFPWDYKAAWERVL